MLRNKTSSAGRKELLSLLRGQSERERLLHRLHSVALVLCGYSCSEVARAFGDSPRVVAYWLKRYHKKDIAGLEEEPRSGRPSKLNAIQMRHLKSFVRDASRTEKAPMTGKALSTHLQEAYGVTLTIRQCRRLLKQLVETCKPSPS